MTIIKKRIEETIEKCNNKAKFHKLQSQYSLKWHNTLSVLGVFISALSIAMMVILPSIGESSSTIAITSAVLSFINLVADRIKTSFNFNVLARDHLEMLHDYSEIQENLQLILEDQEFDENQSLIWIKRWISVNEKIYIEIKDCRFLCCF